MKLRYILIIGIIIRLCIMPFFAHPYDMQSWHEISEGVVAGTPPTSLWITPVWAYTMFPIAHLHNWVSSALQVGPMPIEVAPPGARPDHAFPVASIPGFAFNSLIKIPMLISDVLIALLLYGIVYSIGKNRKFAERAALLWFLNPFSIWISCGWGMFDSLPALFTLASLFFLLKGRIQLSSLSLGLAVGSKLYPVLFLIPITAYLLKTSKSRAKGIHSCARFYLIFLAVTFILFLPYLPTMGGFFSSAISVTSTGPLALGLTYWSVLHFAPTLVELATWVSVGVFVLLLTVVSWKISKVSFKRPPLDLVTTMLACLLVIFLSVRIMAEQYFMWVLPFIVILCVSGRVKTTMYWSLSSIAFFYSIFHPLLPFFLLAASPWIGGTLAWMVGVFDFPGREIILVMLGILFSILILSLLLGLLFGRRGLLKTFVSKFGKLLHRA